VISPDGAPVAVLVVPTDEEMAIALDTMAVLGRP
jgi:acetate kinase